MNKIFTTLAVVAMLAATGCASITQGTSQTIIFNISPSHARCVAVRDGEGQIGAVDGKQNTLTVGKDKDDIVMTCTASGYEKLTQRVVSSTQTAGVVGGIFLDLGITDMITGAMWKYPSDVNLILEPTTPQAVPVPAAGASAPLAQVPATPAR